MYTYRRVCRAEATGAPWRRAWRLLGPSALHPLWGNRSSPVLPRTRTHHLMQFWALKRNHTEDCNLEVNWEVCCRWLMFQSSHSPSKLGRGRCTGSGPLCTAKRGAKHNLERLKAFQPKCGGKTGKALFLHKTSIPNSANESGTS